MLVGKSDTSQPLPVLKDLPVAGKDDILDLLAGAAARGRDQGILVGKDKLCVIDTRKVARASGLHLFGLRGKGEAVDEVIGNVGVPLVGHDEPEVAALAATEAVVTVQDELDKVDGVAVVAARIIEVVVDLHLAAAAHGPDQLNDGVIKVDGDMGLGRGGHGHGEALHGIHELLEAGGGEAVSLGPVQVDIEALEINGDVRVHHGGAGGTIEDAGRVGLGERWRDLDAALERGQLADDLHRVELEGDQGQGIAGIVGEPEGHGHVEGASELGVGDQLGHGVALANHLEEAFARLARELLPHEEVVVVHGVDDLAADDHTDPLGHKLANGIDPVAVGQLEARADIGRGRRRDIVAHAAANIGGVAGSQLDTILAGVAGVEEGKRLGATVYALGVVAGRDARDSDLEVGKMEQVSGPIEVHLDLGAEAGAHHVLTDGFKDKVGVLGVTKAPQSDGGVLGKEFVHGTEGNQLSKSSCTRSTETSHLIFLLEFQKKKFFFYFSSFSFTLNSAVFPGSRKR